MEGVGVPFSAPLDFFFSDPLCPLRVSFLSISKGCSMGVIAIGHNNTIINYVKNNNDHFFLKSCSLRGMYNGI